MKLNSKRLQVPAALAWIACVAFAASAQTLPANSIQSAEPPQVPGHHKLFYRVRLNGRDIDFAYTLCLPKDYAVRHENRPMVVYLHGAGEWGNNHQSNGHGPLAEFGRSKELENWADFIVLCPQCPPDMRWNETPGLGKVVAQIAEYVVNTWRVDVDRVYITGLSMGGAGVWRVALESDGLFAAIAPICAIEVESEKMPAAMKDTTIWIIGGGADGGYTKGARKMLDVLEAHKVDVIPTEVPGRGHDVWPSYYRNRQFYEFLFLHRRNAPPPPSRPTKEQLLAIAYTLPNAVDGAMSEPFKKFLPGWQLLCCGPDWQPGLKPEIAGKKNVFVTAPADSLNPCRLIGLVSAPKDKTTTLDCVVGHHPDGYWQLVVRGNGQELYRKLVGNTAAFASAPAAKATTDSSSHPAASVVWSAVSVDLSRFAGQDVRLELENCSAGSYHGSAYWAQIAINSRDIPK